MAISRLLKICALTVIPLSLAAAVMLSFAPATLLAQGADKASHKHQHQVTIPTEDRFVPYAMTIRAGDTVVWQNTDTDNHTVVSDDAFTTSDNKGTNQVIPGTDNNPQHKPGTLTLKFKKPGVFVYYCRFHSKLDSFNQPVAPGPDGGIQDPQSGNFGTPMTGVIVVLPGDN